MSRFRRPALIAGLITAAVLALPAVSSASSAVNSAGKLLPVGTKVTALIEPIILTDSIYGPERCESWTIQSEIIKNDGTTLEMSGPLQRPGQTGCVEGEGFPDEFDNMVYKFVSSKSGSGTVSLSFRWLREVQRCLMSASLQGYYDPGYNFHLSAAPGGRSSTGCGTFKFTGGFRLTQTGTSNPVILR